MSCHTEQWNEKMSCEKEWKTSSIYMKSRPFLELTHHTMILHSTSKEY